MEYQIRKTDNTLFLECSLFKNRMLTLYKSLETKMFDSNTSGVEIARLADVAASIAHNVLKLESEGIRAIKELGLAEKAATAAVATNKNNNSTHLNNNNNNNLRMNNNNHDDESFFKESNPNRKF
jgi:hypothetical protein